MHLQCLLILFLAILPFIFTFNHDISLEHHDNKHLLFTLKSSPADPEPALSMELDFGADDLDSKTRNSIKSSLASLYQKNDKKETHVETETEPKLGLSIIKSHVLTHDGRSPIDDNCLTFSIKSQQRNTPLSTCIKFDEGVNWFNALQLAYQYWPMEKLQIEKRPLTQIEFDNQAIAEPYFVNSKGLFLYFSPSMATFYSINSANPLTNPNHQQQFCIYAEKADPYYRTDNAANFLNFTACKYENAKVAQMKAIDYFLGKPSDIPDTKMIEHPIWTTWAKYKADIDADKLVDFAKTINHYGFNNSQMEIDDSWEICYGAGEIDKRRFPNMRQTISQINALGFRTTMWVHPFVNNDCQPYYTRFKEMNYLITNLSHSFGTSWWNSEKLKAGHFDFSKSEVADWYINRLKGLQKEIGVDSFKFDAGESSFAPQVPRLNCPENEHPRCLTKKYVEASSRMGPMIEFRTGAQTQYLPNYIRMIDRNSNWGYPVGLPTLVTTLIMMNLAGYPFVMPDMIGGNNYGDEICTEEMFIRWTQANTFMPILQFSIEPWNFSRHAVEVTKKYVDIHYKFSGKIIDAMKRAVRDGTPVNPPIWWVDPTDPIALACDDEFLLGEDVLVAPVLKESAKSRPVYLPKGRWRDEADPKHPILKGPKLIPHYPAPLDVLPYFTKV